VPAHKKCFGGATLSDASKISGHHVPPTYPLIQRLLLVLVVTAGTLLRLRLLTKRDLWVDEALTVVLALSPWREFWKALWNAQMNMGFYYLLMRGWLHLGDSEAIVRGLSVLFGVATIVAIYLLGKRLFDRKVAIISAALSAVNVFQIRYSQEARAYSLVMLLAVLSTYCFINAVDSSSPKRYWAGYVLTSVLGIYTHLFLCLVVAAQWLSLGYARLRLIPRKTVFLVATSFILLVVPLNAFALLNDRGRPDWVPRPTAQLLMDFTYLFTGNGGVALAAFYAALCLVAVFESHRLGRSTPPAYDEPWRVRLVAWWLLFPVASTLLISFLRPVFYDRFMAISAPALALLAGKGVVQLEGMFPKLRGLVSVLLIVGICLSVWGISQYNKSPASQGDDWRLATHYVLAGQQAGDGIFLYRASGNWPFTYYLRREMEAGEVQSSPTIVFPFNPTNPKQEPNREQTNLAVRGSRRVWLIVQHYEGIQSRKATLNVIQSTLQEDFSLSQEQVFAGSSGPIRVLLYVRTLAQDDPQNR
jgi:mannosyltransferase